MKKVFKIYRRDLKTIIKNPAAVIIVLGLCFLPSLYAWINIAACWNPYANTGNLPVAIVNNDEGAVFNGKNLNVGNEIINELKKSKAINWQFVDGWQGNYGLNEGKYYALIEIPSSFSKGLISLTTVSPNKPYITYRVNEKLNAIASKITNAAKTQLATNVKNNFVSTVNKEAFGMLNSLGGQLKVDKSNILQLRDTISQASGDISNIQKFIGEANTNSENLQQYLGSLKATLPKITEQINSLQKATESSKDLVLSTKETVNNTGNNINNDVIQMQSINQQSQVLLDNLKVINNSSSNDNLMNIINQLITHYDSLDRIVDTDIKDLQAINSIKSHKEISKLIDSLNNLKTKISEVKAKLTELKNLVDNKASRDTINAQITQLSAVSNQVTEQTAAISNSFYKDVLPVLKGISDSLVLSIDNLNYLLEGTKVIVPQLNALANFGISTSKLSVEQANDLNAKLSGIRSQLNELGPKMKDLTEKNLDQLINLMEMNPDKIASFLSSPIDVKEIEVYNTGIFGIGLTPFYTVLAIWVGSLLCCALLSVECKDFEDGTKPNLIEKHFGKMLLFLTLSLIQSTIVTLGDKYILGVMPENLKLLMLFSVLSSITFTIIIFTLVSILGNVGKAIAVIIMVFQIAGSGGIYPIQTNPEIFGVLQPLWPFTYAINGFREAIAGPIWPSVYKNIKALVIFSIIFLLLSIFKKPFHKITEAMEHKFKEAGL